VAVTAGVGPRGTARSGATCVVAGCRCDGADSSERRNEDELHTSRCEGVCRRRMSLEYTAGVEIGCPSMSGTRSGSRWTLLSVI